jgi:hypothetical protein
VRSALCFVVVALGACSLEPIDVSDKACPCGPGFVCDDATNRCVAMVGGDGGMGCEPAVVATDFGASWATANVIRWAWTPSGEASALLRYEIHVARSVDELGTSSAVVFGPDENPELGDYVLPRTGGADDVVEHTMTHGLDPMTDYVGRLVAVDTSLCEFRSAPAAISTTLMPPESFLLFGDTPTPGNPFPGTIRVVEEGSERYLEHVPDDDAECVMSGEGVCSQNIRWMGIGLDASDISEGEFANVALLEAVVTNDSDVSSFYSRIWLQVGDRFFRLEPFTYRASPEPRTYQVPLRVLDSDGTPLTHADLAGNTVDEVNVGGQWSRTAPGGGQGRVRIHSLRIAY